MDIAQECKHGLNKAESLLVAANIIFLDVDGVLNGHNFDPEAQSNTINRSCVRQLNRIIKATDCSFVISSAWRYMIHGGEMTLRGFEYLLRTHGVAGAKIIGVTAKDRFIGESRGVQIREWLDTRIPCGLDARSLPRGCKYLAIDDEDWGITEAKITLVQTAGNLGLRRCDADQVIRFFAGNVS